MTRGVIVGDEVDRLRGELEAIDRSLVLLLAERRRAQHRLLTFKLHHRLPLTDPFQETLVAERARAWADDEHADAELAENVVRLAVAAGKRAFFHGPELPENNGSTCTVFLDLSRVPSSAGAGRPHHAHPPHPARIAP